MQGFVHKHHVKKGTKQQSGFVGFFDRLMYGIALIAPVMTLPQLYQVWVLHQVEGVSMLTWGGYAGVSALWLFYGYLQKDKPLMLTQFLLLILDGGIFIGVLWHT